ncbi:hypothetical protein AK812_SmicGene34269 [Symbiodinium microadriaticum]|uniref:Uncharacterized protein n=1 Tax=Symbiodinium microadriaticum TaxID=2951 RepID=A0A1Q9CPG5_SYMMI|nr:hypothetical protein AK812_SmicGene34269 [Symbiodinium microadriaticum]
MPLNILWTQSIFQLLPKAGPRSIVLWIVSSVSLLITLGFISVWGWREHRLEVWAPKYGPLGLSRVHG